tara:strand:- start:1959 stop:2363 length:405 start_codon:yes stop_codon:yes gene_type:complete
MPKLFKNDDYVTVHYSTRRENIKFLGIVMDYINRKYLVKTIVMKHNRQKQDVILYVNTYEMRHAVSEDFKAYTMYARDTFNNCVKDNIDYPANNYYNSVPRILYSSFVHKRIEDGALRRNFLMTKTVERSNYVQ